MADIMNFNPKGTGHIAEVLEGADAKTRALARKIMAHVRKKVPDARAAAYPFWRVDRIIRWPAQVISYKAGELAIGSLERRYRNCLKGSFDHR